MEQRRRKVTYEDAGVHINQAHRSLRAIRDRVVATFDDRVLSEFKHFGCLYNIAGMGVQEPVLVASADGVGTKLKIAFMTGRHDTVGTDIVNHCVNDIIVQGATPLFFLDYLAMGVLQPEVFEAIMSGLTAGCSENGIALIGGETAEMPDFYPEGEYDLAGFIVGMADRNKIIDGSGVRSGDVLLGLASSGLHTNGFSLVRKVLFEIEKHSLEDQPKEIDRPLGEELLVPHRSYLQAVNTLHRSTTVKALIHVTGGGFIDNIPRVLPEGYSARINVGSWRVPGIFRLIVALAGLDLKESFKTLNMGIGLIAIVSRDDALKAVPLLGEKGYESYLIGSVEREEGGVIFEGV